MNEKLENINSELFESFNPDDELWVVGGLFTITNTWGTSGSSSGPDIGHDANSDGPVKIAQ